MYVVSNVSYTPYEQRSQGLCWRDENVLACWTHERLPSQLQARSASRFHLDSPLHVASALEALYLPKPRAVTAARGNLGCPTGSSFLEMSTLRLGVMVHIFGCAALESETQHLGLALRTGARGMRNPCLRRCAQVTKRPSHTSHEQ